MLAFIYLLLNKYMLGDWDEVGYVPKEKSQQQPIRKALYLWSLESTYKRWDEGGGGEETIWRIVCTVNIQSSGEM